MFQPEAFFPLLERVSAILNDCDIRFQLTGGLVAVYYAEPRLTTDADLVLDPEQLRSNLDTFLARLLQEGFLASPDTIRDAASRGKMFQILDPIESLKIDLYPREIIPGALDRSVPLKITEQMSLPAASRPDIIASKILWISKGSHKSRRDVKQIMRRATAEEQQMAHEFADELGLGDLLDEVLAEPDEIDG